MPYRSEAQRRWAHTPEGMKALGGEEKVREWDKESKGKKLPPKSGDEKEKSEKEKGEKEKGEKKPKTLREAMEEAKEMLARGRKKKDAED